MNRNLCDDKPKRIIITSDVHLYNRDWYGAPVRERVQLWVDTIKKEHERCPVDLIIFAGDTSLDHYLDKGTYTANGVSDTDEFVRDYISQLPKEIPIFIGPGNHELYSDEQWRGYTGNGRQGAVPLGDDLFIFVDTFCTALEPNYDFKLAAYTPIDVGFIGEQMERFPSKRVWLVSHYFDAANESEEFKRLVREDNRIIGLFHGHSHQCSVIHLGEEYGNKTIAQTGNFSYSWYTAFPTGRIEDVLNSFWGFRELLIYGDRALSNYIIAKSDIAVINGENIKLEKTLTDGVEYLY